MTRHPSATPRRPSGGRTRRGLRRRDFARGGATLLAATLGGALWRPRQVRATAAAGSDEPPADFPVATGHHYSQASGVDGAGYEVRNVDGVPWWDAYRRLGAVAALGYPIGRPYRRLGFTYQPFQGTILQWADITQSLQPMNVLEWLDAAGHTDWLLAARQIPGPIHDDGAATFDEAVRIRLGWLTDEAIARRFRDNPDPVQFIGWTATDAMVRWGLPMSRPQRLGPFVVQRFQRGALQHWVEAVDGAPAPGAVTPVLIGDVALAAGAIPPDARGPVPSAAALAASHGQTVGARLTAAVAARLRAEPGRWSVFVAPWGAAAPLVNLDADAVRPAASVWKVAAMFEAFRQRSADDLQFDELLTMNPSVLERVDPPASLAPGQRLAVHAALGRMMAMSDNTAAVLLGDRLRYARIDETLRAAGLQATTVNTRLPETTARESAWLVEMCVGARAAPWRPTLAAALEMRALLRSEERNDRIPARLPPGLPVAHKTGDFDGVVNDVGVVYASTGPYTIAVLAQDSPDRDRSLQTGAELSRMIFGALDPSTPEADGPQG